MITIKKGALTYGETQILSEFELEIKKGEFVVICGESGSGKSSLIRILNGLIPELYEGELAGEFEVLGKQLPIENFNDYVKDLGVVFQNPKTQFFMNDVYSELGFSMENYGEPREKMKEQIKKISEIFELVPYWKKSMHELSGGEKQRVAFSSACMMPHELFLLDEPSSNLDEKHIELIQNYLAWLKEKRQTIIVAEHRLYYLMPMADRFIFMQNGQIIHDLTKAKMEALTATEIKSLGLRSLTKPNLKNFTEINQIDSEINVNELACDNIVFSYKKNNSDINIEKAVFDSQKVTGIIGQNGAGKTTFSQLMTGILKPESGATWFNQIKQTPRQLIKKSFLVMQDVNLQLFFETVEKEISAKAKRLDLFDLVVETLQLEDLLDRHPQSLSGGQKQRVAIATAVLSGKEIIIMDEPTSGLDLKHMLEVSDMIQTLKAFNVILLIISHDKEFINLCCDDVLEMKSGRLVKVSENFF